MKEVLDFFKKLAALAAVALFSYLGEKGADGGFMQDIWAAAKTASPFATMLVLFIFLDERKDRKEAQRQCNERTIEFVKGTNAAAAIFERTLAKLEKAGRRVPKRGR